MRLAGSWNRRAIWRQEIVKSQARARRLRHNFFLALTPALSPVPRPSSVWRYRCHSPVIISSLFAYHDQAFLIECRDVPSISAGLWRMDSGYRVK